MRGVRPRKHGRRKITKGGRRQDPPWVYAVVILMVLIMILAVVSKASFG